MIIYETSYDHDFGRGSLIQTDSFNIRISIEIRLVNFISN
jgi:hypothetical protein